MTEAVSIIKRALSLIGAHSDINPALVQTLNTGVSVLSEMLAEWEEDAIVLGVTDPTELTTDVGEPTGTSYAITNNLAVRMAPVVRLPASDLVMREALEGYEKIKVKYQVDEEPYIPDATLSRLLPVGQGSSRGASSRTFFSGKPGSDETSNS